MAISLTKPTVGGSENTWGATINAGLDTIADTLNGTSGTVAPDLSTLTINGTDVVATATELNTASTHYVPSGGIIIWAGAANAVPTGWALCDGTNSTPNLQDRFVVGAGAAYGVGATGGGTATLTEANMPAHTHGATSTSTSTVHDPGHRHLFAGVAGCSGGGDCSRQSQPSNRYTDYAKTGITVSTSTTTTISPKGSGTAFDIIPKYYALAYIMKT